MVKLNNGPPYDRIWPKLDRRAVIGLWNHGAGSYNRFNFFWGHIEPSPSGRVWTLPNTYVILPENTNQRIREFIGVGNLQGSRLVSSHLNKFTQT